MTAHSEANIKKIGQMISTFRQKKGMQLIDLAEGTGISRQTISKIESGTANPTIDTLWKIADYLQVPFASLLEEESQVSVIKQRDLVELRSGDEDFSVAMVYKNVNPAPFDMFISELKPRSSHNSSAHRDGVMELVTVIEGELEVGVGDQIFRLTPLDSMHFRGDQEHIYRNPADLPNRFSVVVYYT